MRWVLSGVTLSIEAVKEFFFKSTDKILIDANVWIYIFFSDGLKLEEQAYSAALKRILAAQSTVYIDALIVSEVVNAHARYRFNNQQGTGKFKAFRQSVAFRPVAAEIARQVKRILSHCTPIESGFSSLRLDSLLDVYAQGSVDFNDQILVEICRTNGYLFITHDRDFADTDIPVLTANRGLLRRAAQTRGANG